MPSGGLGGPCKSPCRPARVDTAAAQLLRPVCQHGVAAQGQVPLAMLTVLPCDRAGLLCPQWDMCTLGRGELSRHLCPACHML